MNTYVAKMGQTILTHFLTHLRGGSNRQSGNAKQTRISKWESWDKNKKNKCEGVR